MQRIFHNLQVDHNKNEAVRTYELLQAFGWTKNERYQQQDISEFNCVLRDALESQMENTEVKGTYKNLFEGKSQNVIKCINIDYESTSDEKWSFLQLNVKGNNTIEDSFKQYIAPEKLEKDNQYETAAHGKQDAIKFIRLLELPPVLQISLNRYEYDFTTHIMTKINQKFQFQEILDLEPILPKNEKPSSSINRYHLHSILVHSGTMNQGHYFAYIKPNLDDRWFKFNDNKVTEVTKYHALGQGAGGNIT